MFILSVLVFCVIHVTKPYNKNNLQLAIWSVESTWAWSPGTLVDIRVYNEAPFPGFQMSIELNKNLISYFHEFTTFSDNASAISIK